MAACWSDLSNGAFSISEVAINWQICSKHANKHGQHNHHIFPHTLHSLFTKEQPENCAITMHIVGD